MGANGLAIESNNEEEEENNPCDEIFCTAGQECVTNIETNEAKCECVKECPYEVHPRRMVKKVFLLKSVFFPFLSDKIINRYHKNCPF